jgi:hypothetical protein
MAEIDIATTERQVMDLGRLVNVQYILAITGGDEGKVARLEAQLEALREELLAGSRSPALRLAVEDAAYRWLDHWVAELPATRGEAVSPEAERRRTWAHRRYLQALAAVERIRRLSRPRGPRVAVQIVQAPAGDVAGKSPTPGLAG